MNYSKITDITKSRKHFKLEDQDGKITYTDFFGYIRTPDKISDLETFYGGPIIIGYYTDYKGCRVFENLGRFSYFLAAYQQAQKAAKKENRRIGLYLDNTHICSVG